MTETDAMCMMTYAQHCEALGYIKSADRLRALSSAYYDCYLEEMPHE